jgi:hypothetical protein
LNLKDVYFPDFQFVPFCFPPITESDRGSRTSSGSLWEGQGKMMKAERRFIFCVWSHGMELEGRKDTDTEKDERSRIIQPRNS